MSTARKCDVCGVLSEHTKGCVTLDVAVATAKSDTFSNWHDVDLCPKHSKLVLDVIGKALNGLRR